MTEFVSVPAIVVICAFIAEVWKKATPESLDKWIPCLCGICGIILSLAAFYTISDYIPANNWLSAVAVGVVSGLSATGANQVYKQLKKE